MPNPDLVVVDGPNFYSRVGEVLVGTVDPAATEIGPYLRRWFDIDRTIAAAIDDGEWPPPLGVALVHSDRPLGRKQFYLDDEATRAFWARQGRLPKCQDVPVRIPGDEVDDVEFKCEQCGRLHRERVRGEKGVDATVITRLFESVDRWNTAVIAANDVDYVPAIEALQRLGRTISIVGRRTDEGSALERRSHDFYEIPAKWLAKDYGAFRCFRKAGSLDQLLPQLLAAGFESGCRYVPPGEKRAPFRSGHDFELIVAHSPDAQTQVIELVLKALPIPALYVEQRNPQLTLFKLEAGDHVMIGIDRNGDRDAAWRTGTTYTFPAALLRSPEAP